MNSTRALRVAHVVTNLEVGGAETALERLMMAVDPSTISGAVWSLRDVGAIGRRLLAAGFPVHAVGMRPGAGLLPAWRTLRSQVGAFMPDIVHGWMYHGNLAASALVGQLPQRPKLLWNIRGSLRAQSNEKWSTQFTILVSRFVAGSAARIVNNSASSVADHIRFGYPADKWCVIPNGFDTARFKPRQEEMSALRSRLGLSSSAAMVIGAVGRHHPIKGHRFFIEAVRDLARAGESVSGVLAGPGWEPDSSAARQLAESDGGLFQCLGTVERTELLLPALDVLCLPSLSEGFPNVVAEAMSCAVPCVVTDVGDVSAIVADTAEIAVPESAASLREAIERIIHLGESERRARGQAARKRVIECYSEQRMATAYQQLYRNVVGSNQSKLVN